MGGESDKATESNDDASDAHEPAGAVFVEEKSERDLHARVGYVEERDDGAKDGGVDGEPQNPVIGHDRGGNADDELIEVKEGADAPENPWGSEAVLSRVGGGFVYNIHNGL